MSLLHDFYHGRIRPEEHRQPILEAHEQRRRALAQREEDFCAALTPEQKRAYIALIDEYTGLLPGEAEEIYIDGMRMGARLAAELLGGPHFMKREDNP